MPFEFGRLFSAEHWMDANPGQPSLFYAFIAFYFAAILGASAYLFINRARLFRQDPVRGAFATMALVAGMCIAALGLFFVLMRYLTVPYLSVRILVYVLVLATLALAAYAAYFLYFRYPKAFVAYQEEAIRKRYAPKQVVVPSRQGRKKKGKRRK